MLIVPVVSNMGVAVRYLASQKLSHVASSLCWCTVMLEHAKVILSQQTRKCDRFARFCGRNCKTSRICH